MFRTIFMMLMNSLCEVRVQNKNVRTQAKYGIKIKGEFEIVKQQYKVEGKMVE